MSQTTCPNCGMPRESQYLRCLICGYKPNLSSALSYKDSTKEKEEIQRPLGEILGEGKPNFAKPYSEESYLEVKQQFKIRRKARFLRNAFFVAFIIVLAIYIYIYS